MDKLYPVLFFISLVGVAIPGAAGAGVANPNLSAIGQIVSSRTDAGASEDANTATLDLGETEIQLDAYLNPYSRGFFVFSLGAEGLGIEETYISLYRNLPVNDLALKAGKYRPGFGKLNAEHPHAYPFIDAPRVLPAMLPGEDGFNEVGAQASFLLPTSGSWASAVSADIIRGSSFHPGESKSAAGWLSRWSNSFLVSDEIPVELGVSATQGTNNVQWDKQTSVYGADLKTKIPFSPLIRLTLQGEYLSNASDVVNDPASGAYTSITRSGFYAFANLELLQRYNAGVIFDQYNPLENKDFTDRAVKCFAGYSLLEETTLFRLAYEQFMPEGSPVEHRYTFQVLFSMGPHKPHRF